MVSNERLSILGVRIFDKRPQSRPSREDVSSTNSDIRREVISDFVEDEFDFLLLGDRVLFDRSGSVGGTGDRVSLPRKEEDDTTIGSSGIDETDFGGSVVVGKSNVNSGSGSDDVLSRGLIKLTNAVRKGSSSVDNTLDGKRQRVSLRNRAKMESVTRLMLTLALVSHSRPVITSRILQPLTRPSESLRRSTTSVWLAATAPY